MKLLYITIVLLLFAGIAFGSRLPTVGGDSGTWGTVLNNFLLTEHNATGSHLNITATGLNVSNDTHTFLYVNESGNVGIGTASPNLAPLQFGNTVGNKIIFWEQGASQDYGFGLDSSTVVAIVPTNALFRFREGVYNGTTFAQISNNPSEPNFFNVSIVGINTSDPSTLLHVSAGDSGGIAIDTTWDKFLLEGNGTTNLVIGSPNNSNGGLVFHDTEGRDRGAIQYDHNDDEMKFWTNGSIHMYLNRNGSLGINTSTPNATLHVNGTFLNRGHAAMGNVALVDDFPAGAHWTIRHSTHGLIVVDRITDIPVNNQYLLLNGITSYVLANLTEASSIWNYLTGLHSTVETVRGNTVDLTAGQMHGALIEARHRASTNLSFAYGIDTVAWMENNGSVPAVYGIEAETNIRNNRTSSNSYAVYGNSVITHNASVTNTHSIYAAAELYNSANTSNLYGVFVKTPAGTNAANGSLNNYGVYIQDQSPSGTNQSWNLYSTGGSNYFSGNVSIGTVETARKLNINDTLRLVPRSVAPGSPSTGDIYFDADLFKPCFYNSTAWVTFDNVSTCA